MSKRKFAKLLQVDYCSVFRYFREGYDPKLSTLQKWADVLGVRISALYREAIEGKKIEGNSRCPLKNRGMTVHNNKKVFKFIASFNVKTEISEEKGDITKSKYKDFYGLIRFCSSFILPPTVKLQRWMKMLWVLGLGIISQLPIPKGKACRSNLD